VSSIKSIAGDLERALVRSDWRNGPHRQLGALYPVRVTVPAATFAVEVTATEEE
jgi:hypothetical protein